MNRAQTVVLVATFAGVAWLIVRGLHTDRVPGVPCSPDNFEPVATIAPLELADLNASWALPTYKRPYDWKRDGL